MILKEKLIKLKKIKEYQSQISIKYQMKFNRLLKIMFSKKRKYEKVILKQNILFNVRLLSKEYF